ASAGVRGREHKLRLAAGGYSWRLRGEGNALMSDERALWVIHDVPPAPFEPAEGGIVHKPAGDIVSFLWASVPGVTRYRFEISARRDFSSSVVASEVDTTSFRWEGDAGEGIYYWRVRSLVTERGESPFSVPVRFRLITKPLPKTPELYPEIEIEKETPRQEQRRGQPEQGWLWYLVGGVAHAASKSQAGKEILLRWEAVPGIEVYELQIAEDKGFARGVLREKVSAPYYRWTRKSGRNYWWRVRSIDGEGREGVFSQPRELAATFAAPSLLAPEAGTRVAITTRPAQVVLQWEPVEEAKQYEVVVASGPGLDRVLAGEKVTATTWRFESAAAGDRYWTVRSLDAAGDSTPFAPPRVFTVTLAPPEVVLPAEGARQGPGQVEFSVRASAAQVNYDFEIGRDPDFSRVVTRHQATGPTWTWPVTHSGRLFWRARLSAKAAKSPWCKPFSFLIVPAAPVVLRPQGGARLEYGNVAEPVEIDWTQDPEASSYTVVLTRPDGSVSEERVAAPPARLAGLGAGSYKVAVRAEVGGERSEPSGAMAFARAAATPADVSAAAFERGAAVHVGASLGVVSNFSQVLAPSLAGELSCAPAAFPESLSLFVRVGYHTSKLASDDAGDVQAVQHAVPIALGARFDITRGALIPYARAAVLTGIFYGRIESELDGVIERTQAGMGGEGGAGVSWPLGRGDAFAEMRYAWLRRQGRVFKFDGGGLAPAVGFRLEL
ncbi:MAG: hypothetical protein HYZ27_06400, partial [Deltaproteobacteria bacterium]|nr:hypothetical protein [Deltaproteobacteria bacterium]